jgi:transposase InsO family protein
VWSAFLQYWLDEARPTASFCYKLVGDFLRLEGRRKPEFLELLPLPDVSAVYRMVKKIPHPVVQFYRYGNKAYSDDCEPYLERDYEGLDSNEVWSADYHTLDFFVKCDITKEIYRPYLCAWIDIRSRKIVGIALRKSADSDGVTIAFRKAVERYGIPSIFYGDNGREFLTADFGGRGRRKTSDKTKAQSGETILSRLGIAMHNSQVANAKAKAIERFFGEICKNFSKFVATYAGGTPADRPERMRGDLKKFDNTPLLSEVKQQLETFIEGYYNNQPSQAKGLKGITPNECWERNLVVKKTATWEQLNLLLLRNAKLQQVQRNGVYVTIGKDNKLWFTNENLVMNYMTHKVYVRYNPEDLTVVHVYDDKERYICEAALVQKGDYGFGGGDSEKTTEAIKDLNRRKKAQKTAVKDFMTIQQDTIEVMPAMSVLQETAKERMAGHFEHVAAVIQPLEFTRKFDKAVGFDEGVEVDLAKMAENSALNKRRRN